MLTDLLVRIGVDLSAIMAEEENQNELVADVSSAFPLPVFLFRVLLFEVSVFAVSVFMISW